VNNTILISLFLKFIWGGVNVCVVVTRRQDPKSIIRFVDGVMFVFIKKTGISVLFARQRHMIDKHSVMSV